MNPEDIESVMETLQLLIKIALVGSIPIVGLNLFRIMRRVVEYDIDFHPFGFFSNVIDLLKSLKMRYGVMAVNSAGESILILCKIRGVPVNEPLDRGWMQGVAYPTYRKARNAFDSLLPEHDRLYVSDTVKNLSHVRTDPEIPEYMLACIEPQNT